MAVRVLVGSDGRETGKEASALCASSTDDALDLTMPNEMSSGAHEMSSASNE